MMTGTEIWRWLPDGSTSTASRILTAAAAGDGVTLSPEECAAFAEEMLTVQGMTEASGSYPMVGPTRYQEGWDEGYCAAARSVLMEIGLLEVQVQPPEPPKEPCCPECGSAVVRRVGKFGPFWGCTAFPACRFALSIKEEE